MRMTVRCGGCFAVFLDSVCGSELRWACERKRIPITCAESILEALSAITGTQRNWVFVNEKSIVR